MRGKRCRIASSLPSFHAFPLHFPWAFCHGHKECAYVLCKKTASGRGGSCTKRGCWEFWLLLNQPFPTRNHFDCSIFIFDVLFFIICNDDSSFTRQYLWQFLQSSYLTVFCCVRALNRIVQFCLSQILKCGFIFLCKSIKHHLNKQDFRILSGFFHCFCHIECAGE